jgi:hypothetical protein
VKQETEAGPLCCGRAMVRWGRIPGTAKQRHRCKVCGRTTSPERSTMNLLKPEKESRVQALLAAGLTIRMVARQAGVARATVEKRAAAAVGLMCPCGRPARHIGWCTFRVGLSPNRQLYYASCAARSAARRAAQVRLEPLATHYPFLTMAGPSIEECDILQAANSFVPKNLPEDIRGDICQDVCVAILTGDLLLANLSAVSIRPFITKFYRENKEKYGTLSLDSPRRPGDDRTLGESIANLAEAWGGHGALLTFRDSTGSVVDTSAFVGKVDIEGGGSPALPKIQRPRYHFRPQDGRARGPARQRFKSFNRAL